MTPEGIGNDHPIFEQEPTEKNPERFDYLDHVESHEFGEYSKAASDVAKLLNDELFQITPSNIFDMRRQAEIREKAFNAYCHLCAKAGIAIPPLEKQLYEPFLPEKIERHNPAKETLSVQSIAEQAEHQLALADASLRYGRLWRQGIPYSTLMLNSINF
jgi:hypothetical protein